MSVTKLFWNLRCGITEMTLAVQLCTGPFRRFSMRVWQSARTNTVRHAMVLGMWWCVKTIFFFLKLYNFVKGIMCIHSIFKNLRPMFSYFTYKHLKIFITCNRTFIASKVWKKIVLIFLYTLYKAWRKSESWFSHSFLAVFPSLVMQWISSLIL